MYTYIEMLALYTSALPPLTFIINFYKKQTPQNTNKQRLLNTVINISYVCWQASNLI